MVAGTPCPADGPLLFFRRHQRHDRAHGTRVLELLGDGIARNKKAIVAALAERYPKDEVERTLMRLAVTGQLVDVGRRYTAAARPGLRRPVERRSRFGHRWVPA